jgi:hypothetical protein
MLFVSGWIAGADLTPLSQKSGVRGLSSPLSQKAVTEGWTESRGYMSYMNAFLCQCQRAAATSTSQGYQLSLENGWSYLSFNSNVDRTVRELTSLTECNTQPSFFIQFKIDVFISRASDASSFHRQLVKTFRLNNEVDRTSMTRVSSQRRQIPLR